MYPADAARPSYVGAGPAPSRLVLLSHPDPGLWYRSRAAPDTKRDTAGRVARPLKGRAGGRPPTNLTPQPPFPLREGGRRRTPSAGQRNSPPRGGEGPGERLVGRPRCLASAARAALSAGSRAG